MDTRELSPSGEKTVLLSQVEHHEPLKTIRKRPHFLHGLLVISFIIAWWAFNAIPKLFQPNNPRKANDDIGTKQVDFADIVPSEKLEWHPCFYNNFCARLTVPMDYHRPFNESKDNPKVHLALVRVPGKRPIWSPEKNSKSPLLINPGGPGGSGAIAALAFGPYIQKIVGEDQDIVGFDPRGIGATTPRADCFSYPFNGASHIDFKEGKGFEDEDQNRGFFHRIIWSFQRNEGGLVNSSSNSLAMLDTHARALAKLCQSKDALHGNDSILRYVHTPSVARDMISIIDAWDAWSDSQSQEADKAQEEAELSEDERHNAEVMDTKGKLVYWGFSYGTLLGATFAAMFPDRVGRVVLDGVVHADQYVAPIWEDSIQDADAIFDSFSTYCHKAIGKCALYKDGDEPEDIADRFQAVMDRIKETPLIFADTGSNAPVIITHSILKLLIFVTLYSPTAIWPAIANIWNLLSEGHDEVLQNLVYVPELSPFCGSVMPYWAYPSDAQPAIMCSDKRYPLNETLPNLKSRFEHMANKSSFADVWMSLMVGCDSWGIKAVDPPMRWDDHPAHKQKPINTSFPVLFISNKFDPVTPLSAGVAMARKFVDAGLIEQISEGHCSLAAVSKCTISKLRAYFLLGQVPSHPSKLEEGKWEKCEADEWPWHPFRRDSISAQSEEAKLDVERMIAVKEMQSLARRLKFWEPKGPMNLNLELMLREGPQKRGSVLPHFL